MEAPVTELHGLLTPFRRDRKRDFASGRGPELLRSKVLQALKAVATVNQHRCCRSPNSGQKFLEGI